MRSKYLILLLAALALAGAGCKATFRAGGDRAGVGAGAMIGQPLPPPPPAYHPAP